MDSGILLENFTQILITILLTIFYRSLEGVRKELQRSEDARRSVEQLSEDLGKQLEKFKELEREQSKKQDLTKES